MTESKLVDSSLWLAYLFNGEFKDIIESEEILLLSVLSLFEIKRKILKDKLTENKLRASIEFIKKRSLVLPINEEIAQNAAEISIKHKLPAIDSLIYSTTILNNAELYTLDNDFRGLKNVVLKK